MVLPTADYRARAALAASLAVMRTSGGRRREFFRDARPSLVGTAVTP
ncbi:hypothetical protein [Deinococcus sp.]